jgi:hypothetical protein
MLTDWPARVAVVGDGHQEGERLRASSGFDGSELTA